MKTNKGFSVLRRLLLALLMLAVLLTGCNLANPSDESFGSVTINVPGGAVPKGTGSSLVTEIESYEITLTKDSYTKTQTVTKADPSATFSDLIPGIWSVAVDGYNSDTIKIAVGTDSVLIEAGKKSSVTIHMAPADGSGTLGVAVSWTENLVNVDDISITVLATLLGSDEDPVPVSMIKEQNSATGEITLAKGTYFIEATFSDSTDSYNDGRVDVVQILADGDTNAEFYFPLAVGGLQIGIQDPDFSMLDLSITGLGDSPFVAVGSTVTLVVSGAQTPESYQWYKNGQKLDGQTSDTLVVSVDAYTTYSYMCLVKADGKFDSATVEFTGMEITENLKNGSRDKFEEAYSLMQTMLVSEAPIVNTRYVYDTLTEAVMMDPDNMDALFSLGMFDLIRFMLDDEIQVLMREGIGFSEYPSTEQELYANILSIIYSFVPNGFNRFLKEYTYRTGEDDEYSLVLPLLSGYVVSDGEGPAYLLQIFKNLVESGYDVDDVFDGILDSLGRSFERTVNNLSALSEDARMHVGSIDSTSYSIAKPEAQLLASGLYALRALASLVNSIELGFDIQNILDGITYDASTNRIDFSYPEEPPFKDGFLQADERGFAYITAVKEDLLTANALMLEALEAIEARTAADDDLIVNPDSPVFDVQDNGWMTNDPTPSWNEFLDVIKVVKIFLNKEKASIEAGGGTLIVIPTDLYDYFYWNDDDHEWYYNLGDLFAYYAQEVNWPTEADVSMNAGPKAMAFDLGVFFTKEFNLLATLLELGNDGEPVLYYYDKNSKIFTEATAYDITKVAYLKIPDITIGGLLHKSNAPVSWSELEEFSESAPFLEQVYYLREDGDAVALYVLEHVFTNPVSYPLSFHALTPKNALGDAKGYFITEFEDLLTGKPLITEYDLSLTSTGSFWTGLIEGILYSTQYDWAYYQNRYSLETPLNSTQDDAYELDENLLMRFYWNDENISDKPSTAWFAITPTETEFYCLEISAWNNIDVTFYDGNEQTPIDGKLGRNLNAGQTYYVSIDTMNSNSYKVLWYEEDGNQGNYTKETAASLDEGQLFYGRTNIIGDYYSFTAGTDQVTIDIESICPFDRDWAHSSGSLYKYEENEGFSPHYAYQGSLSEGSQSFSVTSGVKYVIEIQYTDYLNYTVKWNNPGN